MKKYVIISIDNFKESDFNMIEDVVNIDNIEIIKAAYHTKSFSYFLFDTDNKCYILIYKDTPEGFKSVEIKSIDELPMMLESIKMNVL